MNKTDDEQPSPPSPETPLNKIKKTPETPLTIHTGQNEPSIFRQKYNEVLQLIKEYPECYKLYLDEKLEELKLTSNIIYKKKKK